MLTKVKKISIFLILLLSFFITTNVNAESKTVKNQDELKSALSNKDIDTIILGGDINTTEKINITRPIYLDGKNHTIKYVGKFGDSDDFTVWAGIYVLQVYKTNATIKDIKLTGGNAGLLINGSVVKLEGTIDVSGNGFGGIELGKGANVEEAPRVDLDSSTDLKNDSESNDRPTLWVPDDTNGAVMSIDGVKETLTAGEELSLIEIDELFDIDVNPQTNDSIIIVLIIALSLIGILNIKKIKIQR